ncbi:MAG: ferredoxin oxidoreductase [Candidatus Magasanikbacteria bacterium]|nr:ferredoxin oxidoreductase [Candidatus Magasanikbacteria bacterium]
MKERRELLSGFEITAQAAREAGAEMMYGYPITPATDIFSTWIKNGGAYLQTEDEIAAGFAIDGAVLAGQKAFTATSGPGHILMQDALSMAEGMRLPFVAIIAQRGGPSSGTVIYSQQEVTLACFGGNGEGLRFVYSPSSLEELYFLTRRAFNDAWQYRYPAIVLTDGYLLKTKGVVDFEEIKNFADVPAYPLISAGRNVHWQNIYTFEEDLFRVVSKNQEDFSKITPEMVLSEAQKTEDAEILLVAHGIVGAAAREAVNKLRAEGKKAGLFRPITLRPFPKKELDKTASQPALKKIVVVESSLGQLARLVRDELAPEISAPFFYLQKPALGIEPEKIREFVLGI